MSLNVIDILFLITVVLLVLSGLRTGFVLSLVHLISIPLALGVAWATVYGVSGIHVRVFRDTAHHIFNSVFSSCVYHTHSR